MVGRCACCDRNISTEIPTRGSYFSKKASPVRGHRESWVMEYRVSEYMESLQIHPSQENKIMSFVGCHD